MALRSISSGRYCSRSTSTVLLPHLVGGERHPSCWVVPARRRTRRPAGCPRRRGGAGAVGRASRGAAPAAQPDGAGQGGLQFLPGDREDMGPEPALVGRQLQRAEARRIVDEHLAPVGEDEPGPHPLLVEDARAVAEAVEGLGPVDHESTGHAEANAEGRTRAGVENHKLAPPPRRAVKRRPMRASRRRLAVVPPRP